MIYNIFIRMHTVMIHIFVPLFVGPNKCIIYLCMWAYQRMVPIKFILWQPFSEYSRNQKLSDLIHIHGTNTCKCTEERRIILCEFNSIPAWNRMPLSLLFLLFAWWEIEIRCSLSWERARRVLTMKLISRVDICFTLSRRMCYLIE